MFSGNENGDEASSESVEVYFFFRFLLFLKSSDLSLGVEYCQETIEVEICQYCSSAGGNCARKRRQGHSQGSTTPRGAQGSTP